MTAWLSMHGAHYKLLINSDLSNMRGKKVFPPAHRELIWDVLGMGLEKAMAPHSSTLAWNIPWTEERGRVQSMGSQRIGTTEQLHFHFDEKK